MIYKPEILLLETTNRCNLNCIYCDRKYMWRPSCDMDLELFKKIVTTYPGASVHPQGWGEPLLYPYIIEAVKYAVKTRKSNIKKKVNLYTNGILLNEEMSRKLLDTGLTHINFSVDTCDGVIYEKMRPPAKWKTFIDNIEKFIELNDKGVYGVETYVIIVINDYNKDVIANTMEFWKKRVDHISSTVEIPRYEPKGWQKSSKYKIECRQPVKQLTVEASGSMMLCCRDWFWEYEIGKLDRHSEIEKEYNSNKFNDIRQAMKDGNNYPLICNNCNLAKKGCK